MASIEPEDNLKTPKQIISMGPFYLKYILMEPTQRTISYVAGVFFTTLRISLVAMALVLLPQAKTLMVITDVVSSASAFMQGLKSLVPIIFYKDEFLWLLTNADKFWATNEDTSHVDSFYEKILKVIVFYRNLIFMTYTAYVPVALIFHKLPFITWYPSITGGYYIIYAVQFIMLTFDATLVYASDSYFVGTCLVIYGQFDILHTRLEALGRKTLRNLDEEIIQCVQQHNFLLDYTNVLINMYSVGLVFQFFVTTYSLCIEIFVFTRRDSVGMVIGVIYCSMLISQLAIYCFPADAVIEISQQCGDAIYGCSWYDNSKDLKHVVMNCIQRSHKRLIFTAGGFIDIDKRAFTKIFKGILSLNTLMRNVFE